MGSYLTDLKGTTDDALSNYLNSLKFKQSHTLVDVRLAIGYTAFTISAACFVWDYKLGFEATKYWTVAAVATYTLLNAVLTAWIIFKEKGIIYVGVAPSGDTITVASSTSKNVPIYNLTVTLFSKKKSVPDETIKISRSFSEWFDVAGTFIAPPFQTVLASSIALIGKHDPNRVAGAVDGVEESGVQEIPAEILDAMLADTGAEKETPSTKKGGKRRKA